MNHVYILGGLRSYIGVKDGMYRHIPAEKLGAAVLREEAAAWQTYSGAVNAVLRACPGLDPA